MRRSPGGCRPVRCRAPSRSAMSSAHAQHVGRRGLSQDRVHQIHDLLSARLRASGCNVTLDRKEPTYRLHRKSRALTRTQCCSSSNSDTSRRARRAQRLAILPSRRCRAASTGRVRQSLLACVRGRRAAEACAPGVEPGPRVADRAGATGAGLVEGRADPELAVTLPRARGEACLRGQVVFGQIGFAMSRLASHESDNLRLEEAGVTGHIRMRMCPSVQRYCGRPDSSAPRVLAPRRTLRATVPGSRLVSTAISSTASRPDFPRT